MIRSFNLRDWRLLERLGKLVVPLNTDSVLLERDSPLHTAFLHPLFQRDCKTAVWRPSAHDAEAFVQYRVNEKRTLAHLLGIGAGSSLRRGRQNVSQNANGEKSDTQLDEDVWVALLERLSLMLGDAGIQSMIAEVPENSAAYFALKTAGFAPYTRQDIWKLERFDGTGNQMIVSDMQTTSDWDVTKLYTHSVPNLIRIIEPDPPISKNCWVRYEYNEAVAYAHVKEGSLGMMLWLLVSLRAEVDPMPLIRGIVARMPPTADYPLYCAIRNYQEWLSDALQQSGFTQIGNHVVMVKHTIQHVKHRVIPLDQVRAPKGAKARTSPVIHPNNLHKQNDS